MGKTVNAAYDQDRFAEVQNDAADESATLNTTNLDFSKGTDTTFRVRLTVQQTATAATAQLTITPTLFYSYNAGTYTEIGNPTDTDAPVRVVNEANVTDNATTTLRLGSGDSNVAGRFEDTAPGATAVTFTDPSTGEATEYEWALQIYSGYSGLANDDTIALRVYDTTSALDTYANEPTVTVIMAGEDVLTADDVSSDTAVSAPSVGQKHALLANNAESLSSVSIPTVGQEHALLANDAESASAVSQPSIAIVNIILADDVESASAVSSNVLGQVHALTQGGAESASAVSVPSVGQEHSLLADNAESASALSVPSLGQEHALLADNAESASALSLPSLSESNVLLANDVESVSSVSVPSIGQEHGLLANNAESASQVSAPNLVDVPAGADVLLADDVESLTEVSAPSIGQEHVLLANDVESTSEVSAPNLVDVSVVTASDRGGSSGGGTGRKYKKALREGKGKVRIGRLEDVSLPNPRILIDELTEEIVEEVTKDIKREKPGITLRQLADVIAETKRVLKEKKRLDELKRLIKIAYLKSISDRRKKKALLEAENLIKEEIYNVLEIKAERERIKAEKERKAKRQARDSKDLEVILYILAKVA